MRCPVDNETLVMADRNGVEIDYCPRCRGVWLDRGELDKIIDRATGGDPLASTAARQAVPLREPRSAPAYTEERRERSRHRDDDDDDDDRRRKPKKRESFLSELFDF
ncbi:zf-TFIIB domain-containing protein [Frigidibacter sp. RF13]|uniref:TFIIB-type zinc ribbon-containing protein n=1 Tax=Frigidibacter sp. RF13 TaxID=2997340 RepID=UPI0022721342|nr:zf-TFIIB domain-containing protein [Frigidibacter sp. RF13]MCY1126884.1 zf-TFIIB domain-containing protein [Frigidibacter sp. RF13]